MFSWCFLLSAAILGLHPSSASVAAGPVWPSVAATTEQQAAPQTAAESEVQARTALQEGRFRDAYLALRLAIETQPERPELWFLLGQIVQGLGETARALEAYDNSIALNPEVAAPWFGRGVLLLSMEEYEEATASFERCLALAPEMVNVAAYLGIARLRAGDAASALAALGQVDSSADGFADVVRYRVEALRALGRHDEAVVAARVQLAATPNHHPLRYELALALAATGDEAGATNELRRLVLAEPPYRAAISELAGLLSATGVAENQVGAAAIYRRGVDAYPDDPTLRVEISSVYAALGLQDEAIREALRAVEIARGDVNVLLPASNVLLQIKAAQQALSALETAVSMGSSEPSVYHHLGLALVELQRFDEALAAFARALELDPAALDTRVQAARTALAAAREADAIGVLESVAAAQDDAEAQRLLGQAYARVGRFEEAIEPLRRALELDPALPEAPYLLARAYRALGRTEEATAALEEFSDRAREATDRRREEPDPAAWRLGQLKVRAEVFVAEQRFEEALPVLETAVGLAPQDVRLYELLAEAHEGLGNAEEAALMRARAAELRREDR